MQRKVRHSAIARLGAFVGCAFLAFSAAEASASHIVVQPIQVCNDAGLSCAGFQTLEAETDKIWAQAGIDVQFLNVVQLNETDFLTTNADTVAVGSNPANEHIDLYDAGNALVGDPFVTKIINMYFVDVIEDSSAGTLFGLGCGAAVYAGFCGNRAGVIIADDIFTILRLDTIAHELGHVLGLTHDGFGAGGADNLMTSGGTRATPNNIGDITPDGLGLDILTGAQITEALSSRFVIPAPGSLALFGFGLLGLALRRRSRTV